MPRFVLYVQLTVLSIDCENSELLECEHCFVRSFERVWLVMNIDEVDVIGATAPSGAWSTTTALVLSTIGADW